MSTEAIVQGATVATAVLSGLGANGQSRAAYVAGHLSCHRSIRAIRKRLRRAHRGGARGRWSVAAKEGSSRAQA